MRSVWLQGLRQRERETLDVIFPEEPEMIGKKKEGEAEGQFEKEKEERCMTNKAQSMPYRLSHSAFVTAVMLFIANDILQPDS